MSVPAHLALSFLLLLGVGILALQLRQEIHEVPLPAALEEAQQPAPPDEAPPPALEEDDSPAGSESQLTGPELRRILVVDIDGRPVPGARVLMGFGTSAPRWQDPEEGQITDGRGYAELQITSEFGVQIQATKEGVGRGEMLKEPEDAGAPIIVRLVPPLAPTRIDGIVLDSRGIAVPSAQVRITTSDAAQPRDIFAKPEQATPLSTDAQGRFTALVQSRILRFTRSSWPQAERPPLATFSIRAEHEDDWSPVYDLQAAPGKRRKLSLRFFGSYRITGRVLDENAEGASGVTLRYMELRDPSDQTKLHKQTQSLVTTGDEGSFAINVPATGKYQLVASEGRGGQGFAQLVVELSSERPHAEGQLQLSPARPIRGRVEDQDGQPLSGVLIQGRPDLPNFLARSIPPHDARTDSRGHFDLGELPTACKWIVSCHPIARQPLCALNEIHTSAGASEIVFRVPKLARSGIQVKGSLHAGEPVLAFKLQVISKDAQGRWTELPAREFSYQPGAPDAGLFESPEFLPGLTSWLVFFDADVEGYGSELIVGPLELQQSLTGMTASLPLLSSLEVQVRKADGKAQPYPLVFIRPAPRPWDREHWTWATLGKVDGSLRLEDLSPGEFTIWPVPQLLGPKGQVSELRLAGGEQRRIDLRLH